MTTIHKNINFTLDGTGKVVVGSDTYNWSGKWLMGVDVWSPDEHKTYTTTIKLDGSNWGMAFLRVTGDADMKVKLTDSAVGSNIEHVILGNAGSDATFNRTYVDLIESYDNGVDNVTLGIAGAGAINLRDGNDILKTGSGWVGSIRMNNGNDRLTVGSGGAEIIAMGDGNDRLTFGSGGVEAVSTGSGNDIVNGGSGWVGVIDTNAGNDTINVHDGNVELIRASNGNNTINILGAGWVAAIVAYDDDDTVTISGDAEFTGSISLGKGDNTVTTGTGFVNSIITDNGNDTITVGSGGVGSVISWGGENTVDVNGWVGVMRLTGTSAVTMHAGGMIEMLRFGNGDDSLSVAASTESNNTFMFNGGDGTDDISFASFTTDIEISLSVSFEVFGGNNNYFIITGFENLVTGSGDDDVNGNSVENVLDGGAGNDTLTGGAANDTFIYADGYGDDTVTDFQVGGSDDIDLRGLSGIDSFADLGTGGHMTQHGAATWITNGNGDVLILENVTATDLTAGHFVF
jgi:hypothetical protein